MPAITIKNIPEDLYESLKKAAATHHRSINSELIVCLEQILQPRKASAEESIQAAQALRKRVQATNLSADEIDEFKRVGRR